jgi:hypothetical protein
MMVKATLIASRRASVALPLGRGIAAAQQIVTYQTGDMRMLGCFSLGRLDN